MNAFFETAYAAASGRLCLFVGTGFSKAITENAAPSWQGLLESVCDELVAADETRELLFGGAGSNRLALDECAQIIEIELSKTGKSVHDQSGGDIVAGIEELDSPAFNVCRLRLLATFSKL